MKNFSIAIICSNIRYTQILLLSTIFIVTVFSCKNKACTDCNAINYSAEAQIDNNSCQFVNEDLLGIYSVQDSITGPPTMEWYYDSYDIEISRAECSPYHLIFSNYANNNNSFTKVTYNVDCQIIDNKITISEQEVNGDIVRASSGYFTNDSIYFDIIFENKFGEVFYGKCFGNKK